MVVLDYSIVSIALPALQSELHVGPAVVNDEKDEGAACGAISTMSQIGMGLGVAVPAALAMGKSIAAGVHDAFWSPAFFSVLTLLVSATAIAGMHPRRPSKRVALPNR